jgi:Arc/MetJ family transcription regulator
MPSSTRKKVTVYVDEDVLRAARVRAARTDKRDSDVVEEALRAYLGINVVERVWVRSNLSEDEAMRLAVAETHAARRQRRAARGS